MQQKGRSSKRWAKYKFNLDKTTYQWGSGDGEIKIHWTVSEIL